MLVFSTRNTKILRNFCANSNIVVLHTFSEKNEAKLVEETPSSSGTPGMSIDSLRHYLAEKLGFYDSDDDKSEPKQVKVLTEFTLDGIIKYIEEKKCKNIITMAGAGISTSAGIPDFRSPGTGLYHNLQKYNLPHPQAVFDIEYFSENPKPFFALAKELYPGCFKPTVCHYFIKLLCDKGLLLRHYTQNIDTLERVAGISDEKLVEAHGTFYTGHCRECTKKYTLEWMKERIFKDEIPICLDCPGVVKPDIVFFGEVLPNKFYKCVSKDFTNCDLLIILGSSLVVQPFASLIDKVPHSCPRLLINKEKAGHTSGTFMEMLGMGGGLAFDSKKNTRDVFWKGDCDEGCQLLAEKLGWNDELKEMCKTEHDKIDVESTKSEPKNCAQVENEESKLET